MMWWSDQGFPSHTFTQVTGFVKCENNLPGLFRDIFTGPSSWSCNRFGVNHRSPFSLRWLLQWDMEAC